jgi:uncharacterized membrane protein
MGLSRSRCCHLGAAVCLIALIFLCVTWELLLAPLRPGGSWMVLKVIPLLFPLRGVLKCDIYTMQWSSMLILLYFAEGIVRATSDHAATAIMLGWIEIALSCLYFLCILCYLHPYKKAAGTIARQAIRKAPERVHNLAGSGSIVVSGWDARRKTQTGQWPDEALQRRRSPERAVGRPQRRS